MFGQKAFRVILSSGALYFQCFALEKETMERETGIEMIVVRLILSKVPSFKKKTFYNTSAHSITVSDLCVYNGVFEVVCHI